jgi:hypothetical protein
LRESVVEQGLCDKHIETGCGFKGECASRVKESAAIRRRELAISFGNVEGNRRRRAIQLGVNRYGLGNVRD